MKMPALSLPNSNKIKSPPSRDPVNSPFKKLISLHSTNSHLRVKISQISIYRCRISRFREILRSCIDLYLARRTAPLIRIPATLRKPEREENPSTDGIPTCQSQRPQRCHNCSGRFHVRRVLYPKNKALTNHYHAKNTPQLTKDDESRARALSQIIRASKTKSVEELAADIYAFISGTSAAKFQRLCRDFPHGRSHDRHLTRRVHQIP